MSTQLTCLLELFSFIGEGREAQQKQAQRPTARQLTVQISQQGRPWGVGVCRLQCCHEHHCQHAPPSNWYEALRQIEQAHDAQTRLAIK